MNIDLLMNGQAQADIKSNKKEIHELKLEIDRLNKKAENTSN